MSILITGMEMPTSCDMCWALDDCGDYPRCRITDEQRGYNFPVREKRMDECPLIPVPPHGRLIDADALQVDMTEIVASGMYGEEDCIDAVIEAPTVIPAEEGE